MAKCVKIPAPIPTPPAQYQLTLTEDEAKVLALVMYNTNSPNGQAGSMYDALASVYCSLDHGEEMNRCLVATEVELPDSTQVVVLNLSSNHPNSLDYLDFATISIARGLVARALRS
jgi:hypothetical protein